MTYAITISSLTKTFKNGPCALDNIHLSFSPSQMHAVIGPEGAGKTTLLRLMVGLLSPSTPEGEIVFSYSQQKEKIPFEKVRPLIAYMPERPSLFADLSIREHLSFFSELYCLSKSDYLKKSQFLLNITGLAPFEDRHAGKLSGGMYKKLGLICALLRSPQILLLDEPTNGVDPIARREFWQLLATFTAEGLLAIVTTAYMDEAERCDCVHLLQNGKIILSGPPRDLLLTHKVKSIADLF